MKTLKVLKERAAKATHMTLIETNRPHKYLHVKRRVSHTNTVGFGLIPEEGGNISYLGWPKASELTFYPDDPNKFRIDTPYVVLVYHIHTEE